MGKTIYMECTSGISGDMAAAALLDLGGSEEKLMKVLASIPAEGFSAEVSRVKKAGIDCCDFMVRLDEAHENHDHDMAYLYGEAREVHGEGHHHDHEHVHAPGEEHPHGHERGHVHGEDHHHGHEHVHAPGEEHPHGHDHEHDHAHGHFHRSFRDVKEILKKTEMTDGARALAFRMFTILAEAEGKAHNLPAEEVTFHEVGAIDSIVDIVAIAVLFDDLHIEKVILPSITEGSGTVRCQHGILPVPVPAVLHIAEAEKLPLMISARKGELVTPTGAAFAAAVQTHDHLPERFRIVRSGIGAGKRAYEVPSLLRIMEIEEDKDSGSRERMVKLETDIDDSTGEQLGYVMERLFEAGAKDVHYSPVFMKKNRPAWELCVICEADSAEQLMQIIFRDTTTIGIRKIPFERTVLQREIVSVETPYGTARVKMAEADGKRKYYPEYEDTAEIARKSGLPFDEAARMIITSFMRKE